MKIRQNKTAIHLFGIPIPAHALVSYQKPTPTQAARYVWVEDVRTCGYSRFRICALNCATGERYSFFGDVRKDDTARAFARFADSLPLECIRKPEWGYSCECGPKDRRPQVFDAPRKKPENTRRINDRSVVDGCRIGQRTYTREGYYSTILGV